MDTINLVTVIILTPLIMFGLTGNTISCLTWSHGRQRKTSTAKYLIALAIADNMTLLTAALDLWLTAGLNLSIRNWENVSCKFISYTLYFCPALSSWILVCVAAERALCLWLATKIRIICTPWRANMIIGLITVSLLALYSPILIDAYLTDMPDNASVQTDLANMTLTAGLRVSKRCHLFSTLSLFDELFPWLDLFMLSIIPSSIILLSNFAVLLKLIIRKHSKLNQLQTSKRRSSKLLNSFTLRAIVLSITFLLCTLPTTVYTVFLKYNMTKYDYNIIMSLSLLLYFNHCCNFILYCVTGAGFRTDLVALLRRKQYSGTNASTQSSFNQHTCTQEPHSLNGGIQHLEKETTKTGGQYLKR